MGGKTQTTTQQQTNTPAGLAQLGDIWSRVKDVASTPYQAFQGQLVAGLTPTQQQGIQGVTNAQGSAQPYFDQAANYATQGASTIDPSQIQKYMNPYTQNVIDATKANFQQDNAIGQQQVLGNAASRGALGGDRVGVAQSELARQQGLAQNPVIAGLQQQNYSQALGAAQQDRSAAAQGAYTFGALAPSVQNAQISGAQAQIGAGGLEQGTNQAGLTAAYNQYLQAQAFPYQQTGFLASAGLPAVGAMGGSSAGSTTAPGPNPWAQVAGLGVGAAAAFSDERVKDDIQKVGKTFDGQNIYSFKFKGSPQTHMGLIAQEVEKKHPEAVGEVGGIKTVNYEDALPHKADGGPIGFNDVQTYIPKFGFMGSGANPYASGPTLSPAKSVAQDPFAGLSPMGAMSAGKSAGKGLGGLFGGGDPTATTGFTGNTSEAFPGISDATTSYMGGVSYPMFADGGIVSPNDYVRQGFGDTQDAVDSGAFDPQGANALGPMAFQTPSVPLPRPRPDTAPDQLPPEAELTAGRIDPASPMAMSGGQPVIGPDGGIMPPGAAGASPYAMPGPNGMPAPVNDSPLGGTPEAKTGMGGWNPLNLSDDARMGLLAAGLGVAASKSPFALSAIGEGGLQGVKTYADQKKQREKAESEARKLAQQASQFAQNLGLHKDTLTETSRHHGVLEGLTNDQRTLQQKQFEETVRQHNLAQMQPVTIGTTAQGLDIKAVRDPDSGGYRIIEPTTGKLLPVGEGVPGAKPSGQFVDPRSGKPIGQEANADEGIIPKNAQLVSSGTPHDYSADTPYIEKGMDVPKPAPVAGKSSTAIQTDAEYYLQTGKLPPVARGKSPVAVQQNNYRTAVQNYAGSVAESRGVSPEQTADMWRTAPGMLRFVLGADGRSTVALGTAVRHLDTVQQLAKAWAANDIQTINRLRSTVSREFGSDAATNLESAAKIVGPEIIKALGVAGAGTEHDRSTAADQFSAVRSPEQVAGAVNTVQKLLGGQLEGRKRQAANAGVSEERFKSLIGDRPYEILSGIEKKGGPSADTAKPERQIQNGYIYERQPDGSMKAVGKAP